MEAFNDHQCVCLSIHHSAHGHRPCSLASPSVCVHFGNFPTVVSTRFKTYFNFILTKIRVFIVFYFSWNVGNNYMTVLQSAHSDSNGLTILSIIQLFCTFTFKAVYLITWYGRYY